MRRNLLVGGVVTIVLGSILVYFLTRGGSLVVDVIPSDAEVMVGSKSHRSGQVFGLGRGFHRVTISSEGFDDKTLEITLRAGERKQVETFLQPNSELGRKKLEDLGEVFGYEARSGLEIQALGERIAAETPLIRRLPHIESSFRVDYGASKQSSEPDAVAIYITGDREAALAWIRSQGYDPVALEIIYR